MTSAGLTMDGSLGARLTIGVLGVVVILLLALNAWLDLEAAKAWAWHERLCRQLRLDRQLVGGAGGKPPAEAVDPPCGQARDVRKARSDPISGRPQ